MLLKLNQYHACVQIVELHMNIDCDGCEDNVRKGLLKLEGALPSDRILMIHRYGFSARSS